MYAVFHWNHFPPTPNHRFQTRPLFISTQQEAATLPRVIFHRIVSPTRSRWAAAGLKTCSNRPQRSSVSDRIQPEKNKLTFSFFPPLCLLFPNLSEFSRSRAPTVRWVHEFVLQHLTLCEETLETTLLPLPSKTWCFVHTDPSDHSISLKHQSEKRIIESVGLKANIQTYVSEKWAAKGNNSNYWLCDRRWSRQSSSTVKSDSKLWHHQCGQLIQF